jgi:dihydrofolate reductase
MGRKTYLSIGRALPGRTNIVLSRALDVAHNNSFWQRGDTTLLFVENRETALFFADVVSITHEKTDFFVIGGAEMYRIFEDLFNKVYLTEVITGEKITREPDDAIFDFKFDKRKWKTIETNSVPAGPNDDYPSTFTILERRTKHVRYIDVKNYFTEADTKRKWVEEQLELFDSLRTKPPNLPLNVHHQFRLFEDDQQN